MLCVGIAQVIWAMLPMCELQGTLVGLWIEADVTIRRTIGSLEYNYSSMP